MKWPMGIILFVACMVCQSTGLAQPLSVSLTAFSSSTGATIVARAPFFTSATLEQSSSIGGFANWTVLANRNFGSNDTWQYQDTGATGVGQRYYRLRSDSVYSINIVGLYRISVGTDLALIGNPLLDTNNSVSAAFRSPANGYSLFRLTPSGFVANNYLHGWTTPAMPFLPGEGFFFQNASGVGSTLVFHGEVPLGALTTAVPAGNSLLSSKVPQAGRLEGDLGFPAQNDIVFRLNFSGFDVAIHDPDFGWDPVEPNLNVGEAFWLETDTPRNWTRNFNPNFAPGFVASAPPSPGAGDSEPAAFHPAGSPTVKVNFFTYNSSGSLGRVFDVNATGPAGSSFVGQLYASGNNSEASMIPIGGAVPFQSGQGAGYINSGLVSVPGITPGETIYLQLRAWEGAAGTNYAIAVANGSKNGKSAIFSVSAVAPPDFGPTVPPPSANGFTSFSLNASQLAPSITLQPQSQTTTVGSNVTFCVNATGNGTLWFQWYRDGAMIGGAAGSCLPLTDIQLADAGSYTVTVGNLSGQVTSSPATLTVLPFDGDADGMQDAWEVQFFGGIVAGVAMADPDGDGMSNLDEYRADTDPNNVASLLRFTTIAQTFNDILVQFPTRAGIHYRVESTASLDTPGWSVINESTGNGTTSSVIHSGAGSSLRQFYRLSAARGSEQPRASAVNQVGFAKVPASPGSNQLAVPFLVSPSTVENVLQIVAEDSCVVNAGQDVSCFIAGSWEPPGTSLPRGTPFEFHNPLAANQVLTFIGQVVGKPVIVQQPTNMTATAGASVNMEVSSVGALPLQHQWYFNQTNLIVGATNAVLTLANVQPLSVGGYSVVVSNSSGSVTSAVVALAVLLPLGPTPHISSISMPVNGCNSPCRPVYDQIWSVTSPPYPLNTSSGIGIIVNPQFVSANVNTDFALHENGNYASSHVPQPSRAVVTYQFDQPAVVNQLEIIQHFNGITRVEGFVGDNLGSMTSIGSVFGPVGDIVNTAVGADGDSHVFQFNNSVPARYFRFVVRKTAHSSAFAIHRAIPRDASGHRYRRVPGLTEPPLVTGNPISRTVYASAGVSFTVATDGTPPFEFQWQFNGTNLPGMTSSTLQLTNVQSENAGVYRLIVTNPYGSATSGSATLTVLPCLAPPSGMVAWWPGDGNANDLAGVNHGMLANGASFAPGKVGLGFSFDGTNDIVSVASNSSVTFGSSITLSAWVKHSRLGNTIQRYVTVRPEMAQIRRDGANGFHFAIKIGGQLRHLRPGILPGSNVFHHVVGTFGGGTQKLYVDGSMIASVPLTGTLDPTASAGIEISSASESMSGLIDEVVIYNRALSSNEIAAIYAAGSAGMCKPPIQTLVGGQIATTNGVTVTNFTMLSLQTSLSGGAIFYTLNGSHPGVGTLYTGPVLVSTSVVVRAIAYNADYSEAAESETVTLTVVRSPSIAQQPLTQTVLVGQPAVFTALASGDAPLSYQWFFNGAALAGATSSSFVRDGALLSHAGSYWMVASNPYGSATSSVAGLTVLLRPSLLTQPTGTNINTGQNATFCVNAIGSEPLVFQWRKNGVNIPGATNACYAITNVQATNAGAYSVVVGNGADAVTSAEAELVLADLPNGPPPEDFFANRNGLFGNPGALEVNNIGATKEAGEPDHAGKSGGASVWYAWVPEESGIATLRTSGSAFDTLLAVYRGNDVAALTPVVANEDGGGFLTSEVRFNATNGVEYQIAVDGFAAAQGSFVLSWSLEVTAQVLPVITSQPQSLTVLMGSDAPFSVSTTGSGLKYQWYFNGARLINATNATFIRTNVQSTDVGYYAVAVTNNQSRGLLSEAAILEIGPFPDVRSTDKVEDLLGGPQPAPLGGRGPFQPASSGFASVAIGSLGTQVLSTTNSTTSFRETNHCGVIGGSSRWFKLKPAANGLMSIDTLGSTFDTVLAAYTGDPLLGGYPTRLIECNNNAATDARWSRVLYSATNAIEYLVAVDGANSAAGTVQLNWSLGLPPVIVSNPPPLTPLVGEGEALQLTTALTNGLPPPKLQWYLNGEPILDATNATYAVGAAQRMSGGTYTVVAYNSLGSLTSLVANVTVEVPLELNLQPVQENGKVHFRVSGVASQTFILQGSTNFVNWQPLYTNTAANAPVSFDDRSTTNRSRRYYRALPWP